MAHRVGGVVAVAQQVLVSPVAMRPLVHAVGLYELKERLLGNVETLNRLRKGNGYGVAGAGGVAAAQLLLPRVQEAQAVSLGLVAQVVYKAAEGVYGVDMGPFLPGKEPGADGEVLIVGPGKITTVLVRLLNAPPDASGLCKGVHFALPSFAL